MAIFSQHKDPMRLLRHRLLMVVLLMLIAVTVRGVWGVYQKEKESRQLRYEAELQLEDLKSREASLRSDISELKSDRGREEVLRGEYELAKEGEGLIVIVEPPAPPPEAQSRTREWFHRFFPWW